MNHSIDEVVGPLVVVGVLLWFLKTYLDARSGKGSTPSHVCANCRTVIHPVSKRQGSGGVEFLLWILFIIPGLIYSVWRSSARHNICPVCQAANPVPLNTPAGKALTI
jgi:hypothetical protein